MIVDAALTPADITCLPAADLRDTTCVVFDVLRATSSMVTALHGGASEVYPVCTIEEARAAGARMPHALLGGERQGDPIAGFHLGNSPLEYRELRGCTIISTTTNGTIALRACDSAERVLVAAILNLQAVADALRAAAPERVLLVCAGTFQTFALEDAWGAGRLLELLGEPDCTDAALALRGVRQLYPTPLAALWAARNGRALQAKGRQAEVEWCARESWLATVGELRSGVIRVLGAEGLSAPPNPC